MHEAWQYVLATVASGAAGFLGGVTGIGGASLLIFMMAQTMDYDQHKAQGTALACFMFPKTAPAVWVMRRRIWALRRPILAATLTFATTAISGALTLRGRRWALPVAAGALIAFELSSDALATVFGCSICALGVVALLNKDKPSLPPTPVDREILPSILAGGEQTSYQSTETADDKEKSDDDAIQPNPAADAIIDGDQIIRMNEP